MADPFKLTTKTDAAAKMIDARLSRYPFVLVAVGTGGGKTYMSIHAVGRIIPNAYLAIFTTAKKRLETDWEKSVASYNAVMHTDLLCDVHNYEQLVRKDKAKLIFKQIVNHGPHSRKGRRPVVLILDEVHLIKNPTAKRTTKILTLARQKSVQGVIGLTATAITNSYMDAITYLILAGFYKNKSEFTARHVKYWDQWNNPIVKNRDGKIDPRLFNEVPLLNRMLSEITIAIDTSDLMPPRDGTTCHFQLTPIEREGYRKIIRDYRNGVYDSAQAATKAMREFITAHAHEKDATLSKILANPAVNRPVLIFYTYNNELEHLREYLTAHHSNFDRIEINGHTHLKSEQLAEPKNPRTLFLIQYRAGGEALDAKWSNLSIFYAPSNSYQSFKQAMGRNVRAGQKTGTVYQFRFIYDKTVDEHVWNLLENKEDFSNKLMDRFMQQLPNPTEITEPVEKGGTAS